MGEGAKRFMSCKGEHGKFTPALSWGFGINDFLILEFPYVN